MRVYWFIALVLVMTAGCSAPTMKGGLRPDREDAKKVFVVHNGWHAALVVPKADLPRDKIPEKGDFPEAEYLEISWGDRDYFPAAEGSVGLALRAAFWSRGSVLHIVGFNGVVKDYFAEGEVIEIALSREAFEPFIDFLSSSFSRIARSAPAESRPGLVPHGRFYPAAGRFSILRTCNTWAAEALKSAGLDVTPSFVITAASLARQVRSYRVQD